MRIAFVDGIARDYTIDTAYREPLGGSQSALCYLAENLALLGHEVHLVNNTHVPVTTRGVQCQTLAMTYSAFWRMFDVVVILSAPKLGLKVRPDLSPGTRLILWAHHAADHSEVQSLARSETRATFDGFAFVSNWQRSCYEQVFGIDPGRGQVLRNAIGPAFRQLFRPGERIVAAKRCPPVLAYTSTPFRGLDILIRTFPAIRAQVPGTTLRVYSGMQVYQQPSDREQTQYGSLYRQCQETPGVEYVGSISQSELAGRMREVAVLAYPNQFPETSCIAVLEAMASGCGIITSKLGALSETTAGFAQLIPIRGDRLAYEDGFIDQTVALLSEFEKQPDQINERLVRQVGYVNDECTWDRRALEWELWLS